MNSMMISGMIIGGIIMTGIVALLIGIFSKPDAPEHIRGVPDESLKFISTQNLYLIAMARLIELQAVDDEPLIAELYKRGRSEK